MSRMADTQGPQKQSEVSQILGWPGCFLLLNLSALFSRGIPYQESPPGELHPCWQREATAAPVSSPPATRGLQGWGPPMQRARWTVNPWGQKQTVGEHLRTKFTVHMCCVKNKNYSRSYSRKTKMESKRTTRKTRNGSIWPWPTRD